MTTARDSFVTDHDPIILEKRLQAFQRSSLSDSELHEVFGIREKKGWSIRKAWKSLQTLREDEVAKFIKPLLYRPFDSRWIFYHDSVVWRTAKNVMLHTFPEENWSLCIGRAGQVVGADSWNLVYCSDRLVDFNLFYRGGNQNFPLYLYPDPDDNDLFSGPEHDIERQPNFHPRLLPALAGVYDRTPSPEEVFHYVYAVLYAPSYREKYADFLKIDFPRIPFTSDSELFGHLSGLGERLVGLHLLESSELDPPMARFHGEGDNRVVRLKSEGFRYDGERERKYINESQYFAPIPLHLWEYQIGGYQVLRKWLKDRKERKLTTDEIRTYCRIVTALEQTMEIQEEIDALYPQGEAEVVELHLTD